ncbi:GFA family protein [Zooshikella ganghwensis]|uniref:GFA family protein n=1 Tax=Zooshikella ganghwensis TaxID=202772 RepID=UPI0003FD504A|nr:GFA family protein [Zooshikella ganghwensis]
MSTPDSCEGTCLCGAVKIHATNVKPHVGACHCGMCRKWSGGPLLAVECGSQLTFEGKENITAFSSSAWAERGFCKHCGTHIFYHLKDTEDYIIPAGFFDKPTSFTFDHQIFIDKKPDYYTFANETENMTEAEVFAKYMPAE